MPDLKKKRFKKKKGESHGGRGGHVFDGDLHIVVLVKSNARPEE